MSKRMKSEYDLVIVGSGIAGLSFALKVAEAGYRVAIFTKKDKAESNTNYAQGGIAAVTSAGDDLEKHIQKVIEKAVANTKIKLHNDKWNDKPATFSSIKINIVGHRELTRVTTEEQTRYNNFCEKFLTHIDDTERLIEKNRIFRQRSVGIGVISKDDALEWGFSGPCLRASGCNWDLRKKQPYDCYPEIDFKIPTGTTADVVVTCIGLSSSFIFKLAFVIKKLNLY